MNNVVLTDEEREFLLNVLKNVRWMGETPEELQKMKVLYAKLGGN
jgi:hypothetical protein